MKQFVILSVLTRSARRHLRIWAALLILPLASMVSLHQIQVMAGLAGLAEASSDYESPSDVRVSPADDALLTLENDHLRLTFRQQVADSQTPRQGSGQAWGLALESATTQSTAYSFTFDLDDLWAVTLRATDGTTTTLTPSGTTYTLTVTTNTTAPTRTLTAVWQNVVPASSDATSAQQPASTAGPGSLTITTTVSLAPDDFYARWTIAVDNRYPDQAVYHVDFPRLKIQPVGTPATNRATVPYFGGRVITDPIHSALQTLPAEPPFFPYPHMNTPLQLFTYTSTGLSTSFDTADAYTLYLAAHDGAGYSKAFDFRADGQRLLFGVRQFPEYNITPGNDYASPYPVAVGVLPGDWYDAAKGYRAWALQQPWAQRGPIALSDDFSAKLKASTIMGVWGPITSTAQPFEAVAQDMEDWATFLGIEHVAGLWYGWHGNAFDTGWPEYEPVEPSFGAGVTLTHHFGNYAWPYILPTGWDTATASYTATHAAAYAMKDEQGNVQTFTTPPGATFATMDPATAFWQTFVRDWVLDLQTNYDVDGIYLDVWSGGGYGFDYDATHGHPTGGGNYIAQGMRTQGQMIRQAARARDPEFIMMSEHPGELFMDLLEIENVEYMGPLNPAQWWAIPLFNTVYHDYIMMSTFVNTSSRLPDSAENEAALSWMWAVRYIQGNLLAVNGDGAPVLQDPVENTPNYGAYVFLRKLVQSYRYADSYLRYGERLRDLPVEVPTRRPPSPNGVPFTLAPYALQQPRVLSSVWRSVTDDSVGLVFTNWVTTTETITYTFDPAEYGLPASHLGLYRLDADGPHLLTRFSGPITRTETVPARSLRVLMVAPCPHPYDLSGNGVVDAGDIMTFVANQHTPDPDPQVDLNGNGDVDMADVAQVSAEWRQSCPVAPGPTPAGIMSLPVLGEQKVLFISVYYPGEKDPLLTEEEARQDAAIVKEALEQNSYGRATFTIDVTPPLPMPQPVAYYQNGPTLVRVRADALQAAREAGFPVDTYDREVIISPKVWAYATGQGTLNAHTALVACRCPYLVLHELGHSFDWMHANFWQVTQGPPTSPNGTEVEYGDPFDIMGDQLQGRPRSFHHYNPWFKFRAGWVPPANILDITQAGVYTVTLRALELAPLETTPVTEYSAVRIPKDAGRDYWLFYRSQEPLGNDGLILTWGFRTNIAASLLLDMTPGSQEEDWQDVELTVGKIFADPEAGIEVRVLEKTPDTLRVKVHVQPRTVDRLPVIDVLSPGGNRTVNGAVTYQVAACDPDGPAVNGSGIETVQLYLHIMDDPLIANLRQGLEPPHPVVTTALSAPPYTLEVQTGGDAPAVPDGIYALVVTTIGQDGGRNTVWYPHIIDNTGPSVAQQAHTTRLPLLWMNAQGFTRSPACRFAGGFTPLAMPLQTTQGEGFVGWDPFVLFDEEAGRYQVWYTLYNRTHDVLGIRYGESADGRLWNLEVTDTFHVLEPTPGSWDAEGVETVSVLKKDGLYRMWYLGYPCDRPAGDWGKVRCIGLATSDDGIHWTKYPTPVLKPTESWEQPRLRTVREHGEEFQVWDGGVMEPAVVWDAADQLFKMWYTGVTVEEVTLEENGERITRQVRVRQVGYATSPDGIHWTKYPGNPVFTPLRNDTTWEEAFAVDQTNVLPDPLQGYHMFYFSGWSIGHAYSRDGIHWERDRNNPILQYQPDTGQGVLMFGGPTALLKDDTVWLYFMHSAPEARRWGDGEMRIGLAAGP